MPLYPLFAFDDSDIFHEKVFLKAVKKSDYAKASEMIQMNVSINALDSDGLVPMAYALANEDSKMFDLLSKAGARINALFISSCLSCLACSNLFSKSMRNSNM